MSLGRPYKPHSCPECKGNARQEEPGEYALINITDGRIQLHTDAPETKVFAVRATVCQNCRYVTLHESV